MKYSSQELLDILVLGYRYTADDRQMQDKRINELLLDLTKEDSKTKRSKASLFTRKKYDNASKITWIKSIENTSLMTWQLNYAKKFIRAIHLFPLLILKNLCQVIAHGILL